MEKIQGRKSMLAALKKAYNLDVSQKEAFEIKARLVFLIRLLDVMDKEQAQEVKA